MRPPSPPVSPRPRLAPLAPPSSRWPLGLPFRRASVGAPAQPIAGPHSHALMGFRRLEVMNLLVFSAGGVGTLVPQITKYLRCRSPRNPYPFPNLVVHPAISAGR